MRAGCDQALTSAEIHFRFPAPASPLHLPLRYYSAMDEKYRLIFRGELLDGQHRAVVKRRLTELLKLKEGQAEKLFSDQPVVLKREADRETAARYQALFKKAGAQLRVKADTPTEGAQPPAAAADGPATAAATAAESAGSLTVQPRATAERIGRPAAADIDAPDFKVQSTWFSAPEEPRAEIEAPDFSVAAVGSDLAEKREAPAAIVAEVNFDLAEVGADLLTERKAAPVVELGTLDFEVAEVGADIGTPGASADVAAPDVSHIALVEP